MSEMQTNPTDPTQGEAPAAGEGEDEKFAAAFEQSGDQSEDQTGGEAVALESPVAPEPETDPEQPEKERSEKTPAGDTAPAPGQKPAGEAEPAHEPSAPEAQAGDEMAELRRKARLYDATEGRLRQTQAELTALKRKADAPPAAPQAMAMEEVPEEIREDMAAFLKTNPEYAPVMLEKSKSGERLRRALEEYGPEHVLVEDMADRTLQRLAERKDRAERAASDAEAVATEHFAAIGREHPDFAEAYAKRGENPAAMQAYRRKLEAWAETKPGAEYKRLVFVMDHGTAPEVNQMLRQFKDDQAGGERRHEKLDRAAQAAMVPPGKPSPRPRLDKSSGTFDDGWDKGDNE